MASTRDLSNDLFFLDMVPVNATNHKVKAHSLRLTAFHLFNTAVKLPFYSLSLVLLIAEIVRSFLEVINILQRKSPRTVR